MLTLLRCIQGRRITAARRLCFVWLPALFVLGALSTLPAAAQVRPASEPIAGRRIQRVIELIPDAATDLPSYLVHSQDVYCLVTAGGAYTEIEVLANPEMPAATVAQALSSALAGTSLSGRPVEWSADRYSAAKVLANTHHFGALRGSNTVSIVPLMTGLRRAGLTPHLLLRIPRYAQTSLPPPGYETASFRWYDAHHLGGQSQITVTGTLSPLNLAAISSLFLVIPVIGFLGLSLAGFLIRREQQGVAAQRKRFQSVSRPAMMAAMLAQFAGVFFFSHSRVLSTLADLWFGSSSLTVLFPFLAPTALSLVLLFVAFHREETRRFGAAPTALPPIPMSDEEKVVRKRVAQWSAAPHFVGVVALGAVPFFVTRTSPLYPYIHPVAIFLPLVGAALAGRILQTRLAKFTQKTLDDDLTWRARQLGQALGVQMPDVFVEDSSRAAHLAFAAHSGHHITLSRKLTATFTPAETDFVLAYHLAGMKRRSGSDNKWMRSLLLLPMLIPVFVILSPRIIPGVPTLTTLILSPWFLPTFLGYLLLTAFLLIPMSKAGIRQQIQRDTNADRVALEVTGNLAAAGSALIKLETTDGLATLRTTSGLSSQIAGKVEAVETGRLMLRRAALQKTAQTLQFAPAPGTEAKTDTQITR